MVRVERLPWIGRVTALAALLILFHSRPAGATCPTAQLTGHLLGGFWFEGCDDATPVSGFMFLGADPSVNSGGNDFVCEVNGTVTSQGFQCQNEAGYQADGRVTLAYAWGGSPSGPGCPNPAGLWGVGRIFIHTVGADGGSIVLSLGYEADFDEYVVEKAHPYPPFRAPLFCGGPERRFIFITGTSLQNGVLHVDLTLSPPPVASDCDPESINMTFGNETCQDGLPAVTSGRVYTKVLPCNAAGGDLRLSSWTFASDVDAQGHASLSLPSPGSSVCVAVGATYRLDGQEVPAVAGFVKTPGDGTCADLDGDGWTVCDGDCNDSQAQVYPGAPEVCNRVDDDCDTFTDDGLGQSTCGIGACRRTVDDCFLGVPQTCVPGAPTTEVCDGIDNDCDGVTDGVDGDHDDFDICIDCNDQDPAVYPGATELCNGVDDNCNHQVDDSGGLPDGDADGVAGACDNCPLAANADQGDIDLDAEGNVCDFNDGLILIRVPDDVSVEWQQESGFETFNLYRGDLALLHQAGLSTQDPAVVPLAAKNCLLAEPQALDGVSLGPGEAVFYLVTGNGPGGESSLGTNSAGQPRPNTYPCP